MTEVVGFAVGFRGGTELGACFTGGMELGACSTDATGVLVKGVCAGDWAWVLVAAGGTTGGVGTT